MVYAGNTWKVNIEKCDRIKELHEVSGQAKKDRQISLNEYYRKRRARGN